MAYQSTQSEIVVFFTGGTIGMSPSEGIHGVAPGGNFEKLLNQLAPQEEGIRLTPVAWSDKPSPHMTPSDMFRLAKEVDSALGRDTVLGAVILHGTDVLAESAYMCDLVINSDKPVILTGSMRYYSESGYDGVRNLINAVRACLLPIPTGTGACILMTDRLFTAREAVKVNSLNVDAFESREAGVVGYVAGESVILAGCPLHHATRHHISPDSIEPNVALITAYTGMDRSLIDHVKASENKGIVIEGFGAGNVPPDLVPALEECMQENIPVVLATRCIEGGVWPIYGYPGGGADLEDRGVILCGRLGGPKARIRLMCVLGITHDMEEIRSFFEVI
ncbi:asparaginase [Pseudodesulfovibrio piezophilus]|uniref:Putative Asparaginase/glutaminase n=1 Tax=Pseudodesulfovibrio piezophilus (strain DSM 21447 / JCM 15486 / C1TLV30) TaxID=1322246 RepID=M1WMH4_PSEP2|nr:asparaginase [Pseudodesulfovibrio piezophilus]CCH49610.1 putative Asparaginase/glutaminase [Pseudodesulfovibrio piezophilus C1TLV30]